ncbi:MAG: SMI1/KNR4 family protein [Pedosphaera sp.]|nr:SMI1/KNR4 family protein [Pedosphaera sp.]
MLELRSQRDPAWGRAQPNMASNPDSESGSRLQSARLVAAVAELESLGGITRSSMTRAQIHDRFVAEFHDQSRVTPATLADLATIEQELGTVLPQSYLSFMQEHGAVRTPSLLDLVVNTEAELWVISNFIAPADVVRDTRGYWSGGMSDDLIGFADDGMGDLFCFRRLPVGTARPDDSPVWFFDHEFCDHIRQLADSFDDWMFSYLKLKRQELSR